MNDEEDTELEPPAPAHIELTLDGQQMRLAYEQAFSLASQLLERGDTRNAARLFERLEEFTDRGPRAFIMQAFCEAAAMNFDRVSPPLTEAFRAQNQTIATALHNAFISYHVGIRQDGLNTMVDLVNKHQDLPTLCLLLGNMLQAAGQLPMARKCWAMAIERDRKGGAVAAVAARHLRKSAGEGSGANLNASSEPHAGDEQDST
jgi:hypothetical protein